MRFLKNYSNNFDCLKNITLFFWVGGLIADLNDSCHQVKFLNCQLASKRLNCEFMGWVMYKLFIITFFCLKLKLINASIGFLTCLFQARRSTFAAPSENCEWRSLPPQPPSHHQQNIEPLFKRSGSCYRNLQILS